MKEKDFISLVAVCLTRRGPEPQSLKTTSVLTLADIEKSCLKYLAAVNCVLPSLG